MISIRWWRAAGILTALASLAYFLYQPWRGYHETSPFFVAFMSGASILRSGSTCLYCNDHVAAAAAQYLGISIHSLNFFPYNYPPPIAVLFEPLTYLSPHVAFAVFTVISLLAMVVAAWLLYRYILPVSWRPLDRSIVVVLATTTVGSGIGLRDGALDPLLFLALVAALLLRRRGQPVVAGFVFAILLAKPQTIWLIPPLLLIARDWRVLWGFVAGGVAWLVASMVLVSPSAIFDWIRTSDNSSSEISLGLPGVIGRITGNVHYWMPMVIICGAAALLLFWLFREQLREQPELALAIAIAASLALSPHLWEYDMVLAALPLCLWARTRPVYAIATALFMSLLFTVNRSQGWEDDLVWVPEALIAWGLLSQLRATPRAVHPSQPRAHAVEHPGAPSPGLAGDRRR